MPPEKELIENGETDAFLEAKKTKEIIQKKGKDRRDSGLQDFLRSISSTATLPAYIKGTGFSSKRGVINQCLVTVSVLLLAAGCGQPIGFSAVLLPQLYNENTTMRIDKEMGSWIASIHSAATPIGSFASGPLMEALGRRRALQLALVPLMAGWVIIATAPTQVVLLAGRIVCGFAVGITAATNQVYLGEISEPRLRGILSGFPLVAYSLGILFIYCLGAAVPWRVAAAASIVLPLVSILALSLSPESPTWLARKGKFTLATRSIARLRGDELTAQRELHQLMSAIEKEKCEAENQSFWSTIKQVCVIKPLVIINVFNILQALSGTYMIVFYAADIVEEAAGGGVDSLLAANVTAVVRLIFTVIGCVLLFYVGRRFLAMLSGVGSTVSTLALGVYIWCKIGETKTETDFWITAVCLMVYIASNTVGFFILPGLMIGELLPANVRGMCGGYLFTIFNLILFGLAKLFPMIIDNLGCHGMFILFGTSSFFGTIFLYLFLPETKGKSLIQIEQYFKKSNFMWITREKVIANSLHV